MAARRAVWSQAWARALLLVALLALPSWPRAVLTRPLETLAATAAFAAAAALCKTQVKKQIKWAKKMSKKGPLAYLAHGAIRLAARLIRKMLGNILDQQPKTPKAIGAPKRKISTSMALIRWIPDASSSLSRESYQAELRSERDPEWQRIAANFVDTELEASGLDADSTYMVRVRAVNSRGKSPWLECTFRTNQVAINGGGRGDNYQWEQPPPFDEIHVRVPLPAKACARDVRVELPRGWVLTVSHQGSVVVSGELWGGVVAEDVEWELEEECGQSATTRHLLITLLKRKESRRGAPLWPSLFSAGPFVDISPLASEHSRVGDEALLEGWLTSASAAGRGGPNSLTDLLDDD